MKSTALLSEAERQIRVAGGKSRTPIRVNRSLHARTDVYVTRSDSDFGAVVQCLYP